MKILVSACILGDNCKYNGESNKNPLAISLLRDKEIISICPEVLAGMEVPRPCAENINGIVTDKNGNNVHVEYTHAVEVALSRIEKRKLN